MANGDYFGFQGQVQNALPTLSQENNPRTARMAKRGEQFVSPLLDGKLWAADEGAYFVATNPTPETGITGHAANTTLDDTKATLFIKNGSATAEILLDYIQLTILTPGTNGTSCIYAIKTDDATVNRWSSGGSTITPVNPNANSSAASAAVVKAGAVVLAAAGTNARLVSHKVIRPVIPVVGDCYLFDFGGRRVHPGAMVRTGTAIADLVLAVPPVIIGPGMSFCFHLYEAAQTVAGTFEFEMGWYER